MHYNSSWKFFTGAGLSLTVALLLLYRADALKHAEMLAYANSTGRQVMAGIGGGVALMAWTTILGATLSEWFARKGWDYTRRGAASNGFALLVLLGGTLPWIFGLGSMVQRWDRLEAQALKERGVEKTYEILRTERTRGRHRWLSECKIMVRDAGGKLHTLLPVVPEDRLISAGDSLLLRYLPANPTVFQILGSMRKGNDMVTEASRVTK